MCTQMKTLSNLEFVCENWPNHTSFQNLTLHSFHPKISAHSLKLSDLTPPLTSASETYRGSSALITRDSFSRASNRVSRRVDRTLDMTYEIDDPVETPPSFKRTLPYRELRFLAAPWAVCLISEPFSFQTMLAYSLVQGLLFVYYDTEYANSLVCVVSRCLRSSPCITLRINWF